MLIYKFKHKLTMHLEEQLNFEVKISNTILVLVKLYLFIYKQISGANRLKNKTTPL